MDEIDLSKSKDSEKYGSEDIIIHPGDNNKVKPTGKKSLKDRFKELWANPKKRRMTIIIGFGLVLIILVGTGLYFVVGEQIIRQAEEKNDQNAKNANAVLVPSPLTGVSVDAEAANRHPLAVMIENHPDARPQAGLNKADIVYEALTEGGITRFMAIFGSQQAEKVGPVRSARPYYLDWSRGYEAYFAHVGGSIDALDQIKNEHILDLDQSLYPGPYWREANKNIAVEHTMYTTTNRLWEQASKNKYSTANNFNVMKFKDEPTAAEKAALPTAQKATIDFSNDPYKVVFEYDKTTNSYKRFLAGAPHVEQVDKQQVNPKNVIIMTVQRTALVNRVNKAVYTMTTVGTGPAKILIDGKTISGTWRKTTKTDRELFYDESGNEINFNKGSFWISAVPPEAGVKIE